MVFANSAVYGLLASDDPKARWRRWFAYLLMPLLIAIAVQKGDRTGLIALGVGAGWCYTQRIARLRWAPVLAVAFVALIVMPVISEWRAQRSIERSTQAGVYELLGSSLYNMGSSVNALVYTLELIPREKDYAWGSSFWSAILQAVPNVGLTKGKEWAGKGDTPSNWITWVINPIWASTGGGYGYSMSAEWYYNFGLPGLVLGMALTGWLVARVRNNARNSSLALTWSATLFAGVAIWSRNIVGHPLKVAVWPIIGIWAIHRLLLLMRSRSASRPPRLAEPSAPDALTR
jgi:oligosaccharide repeat unit polymerase